jgi:uncharacterized protein YjiS (DUF1127 family)
MARSAATKAAPVRVTAVASIARTGMFRKHVPLKVSQTGNLRETLMLALKQMPYDPSSSPDRAPCRLDGHVAARERSSSSDKAPLSLKPQEKPQRTFLAAPSRLFAETFARIPVHAGSIFLDVVPAVFSWVVAEFLAGCAAYAEAWHPTPVIMEGRVARRAPEPPPASSRPGARSDLKAISSKATPAIEGAGLRLVGQARSLPATMSCPEHRAPTQHTPSARQRWYAPIRAAASVLLSAIRERQARHQALIELWNFDDRMLRDIGISRGEIESIGRRTIRRE